HTGFVHVFHVDEHTALGLTQIHQRSHIVVGGVNVGIDKGLLLLDDAGGVRVGGRVVDDLHGAVGQRQAILNTGRSGDQIQVKPPLQTLGDDFHVQKPQETA